MQHSGHTGQIFQTIKNNKNTGQLRYAVKFKVRKMAKSLLDNNCYCPMLLMRITKTAVCL